MSRPDRSGGSRRAELAAPLAGQWRTRARRPAVWDLSGGSRSHGSV